jgi:hypothetical protein
MGRVVFSLCFLLLAGCASRQELAASDDATCQSYGAPPGSQNYFDCRMNLDQARAQNRRAAVQGLANGLSAAGQQMSQRAQSAPSTSTSTHCTSQRNGNQIDTVCN